MCALIPALPIVLTSCNAQKVAYFQDANDSTSIRIKEVPFRIKCGDKLNIVVNSSDAQVEAQFTLTTSASRKLTRLEVAQYLTERLISRNLVRDPVVTVEYVNLFVSVVGEVNKPGRINIENDQMTIMEALALVGDLTINGDREHVLVTRRMGQEAFNYTVNLLDQQTLMESPVYHLQQGDVIYVTPNLKRRNESTDSHTLALPHKYRAG